MIRSAFVDLISEKKLISNITVAELAERADIAKSTFYNHYDDVYSIADEILRELISELENIIDEMDADKTADYRVYIKRIFVIFIVYFAHLTIFFGSNSKKDRLINDLLTILFFNNKAYFLLFSAVSVHN